jgi:hypothetical protein
VKLQRICQGDIFTNIEIIENINVIGSKIVLDKVIFPYIVCLNQECDLEQDFNSVPTKDTRLLHLAIAPAFNFEDFLSGSHWGGIFTVGSSCKRSDTKTKIIIDNEIPRYHYLKFPDTDMPELIVDFKHFFTINREFLYTKMENRLCSLDDLFREKISQRFSNFLSRIGLPEEPIT